MAAPDTFDVIVVGGGPAGSAMAWSLASRGIRVAVIERATYPREKVCGDFVEPAGLRILAAMGAGEAIDPAKRLPITRNRVYFGPRLAYQGEIPYYEGDHGMPRHGFIVPRHELDTVLLQNAEDAGATVHRACEAREVRRDNDRMHVDVRSGQSSSTLTSRLVIGADGVESIVARSAGLRRTDRRHIGVSRRVYLEGVEVDGGEATIWFDEDHSPGYGWMFPMPGGRANMGLGMLSEGCERFGLSVPKAFGEIIDRLRLRHPGCRNARLASRPLGGIVKMYGGIDRNSFDGGLLIGDAGSFVDPMTGEGITQGMESALIASRTVVAALEAGRFDAPYLARFDRDFRAYFDAPMLYLDLCATITRNWHFREYYWRASLRGFEKAQTNSEFGRVSGTTFGGLNVQPQAIVRQIWASIFADLAKGGVKALTELVTGRGVRGSGLGGDIAAWTRGWNASLKDDPAWHFAWLADVAKALAKLKFSTAENPRLRGPLDASLSLH